MQKRIAYIVLFVLLVISGFLLINYPTTVGVADNTDYDRVIQPLGITSNRDIKYFYLQEEYDYVKQFNSLQDHISFVMKPNIESIAQYKSTHFAIVKTAQIINGIIKFYREGTIASFDIRILSILYIIILSLAIVIFIKSIHFKNIYYKIIFAMVILFIYYDKSYLISFNSFFGEPLIFVSFLLYFACIMYIINAKKENNIIYILSFISACMFIGAKVADIPLGFLMILFSIILFCYKKAIKTRIIIVIGIVCMLITSVYYLTSIPEWMGKVNGYHALFYGVLKDSPTPKQDLIDLGIDEKYEVLKGTHSYMDHKGYELYSDEFQEEVLDKATPFKISMFYLTHFDRLIEKIDKLAKSSTIIRPPYLGNYKKEDSNEIVKFDGKWSYWEKIRKSTHDNALLAIVVIVILYIITSYLYLLKIKHQNNKEKFVMRLACRIMLIIFAGSQFILPVVGNGEADLIKHMFLFNLLFDMMIIMCCMDILYLLENRQMKIVVGIFSSVVGIIVLTMLIKVNHDNSTVVFGKYNNQDIVWEVLEETDDYYFVASKQVLDYKEFEDNNSNLWIESDIRRWLNSDNQDGFLHEFSNVEKQKVFEMPAKTIVSPSYQAMIEIGEQPHYWYCIPGYIEQNFEVAYSRIDNEKVFLLGVREYEKYAFQKKKKEPYWLRTPYTNPKIVRVVGLDGFVYHKEANTHNVGIVPCMYIKK